MKLFPIYRNVPSFLESFGSGVNKTSTYMKTGEVNPRNNIGKKPTATRTNTPHPKQTNKNPQIKTNQPNPTSK